MATAIDVMKYIKAKTPLYGEVQLQKLMYYSQSWSLAWDGHPLFPERIEAWQMGPVVPAIRYRTDQPDETVLTVAERATVDAVLAHYGRQHGAALIDLSHSEAPWADVWGTRSADARCTEEIPHDAMRTFYTEMSLTSPASEIPQRQSAVASSKDEEVKEIARASAEQWRDVLAILAQ